MRRASIALGGVLALVLCSQALADHPKPGPVVATSQGGGGGAGRQTTDRRSVGGQTSIGSATTGAGSGIGRVNACATGPHRLNACASGQH